MKSNIKPLDNRKLVNDDIIKRLRAGESLTSFTPYSSWFPPRPIIQKDPKALASLYGKETK